MIIYKEDEDIKEEYYVDNWSLWLDFVIPLKTAKIAYSSITVS